MVKAKKNTFDLSSLNAVQAEAVEWNESPVLIFAGAGSGKTRVLAHKIAYLVKKKIVAPENILALTFTNKAAREMVERVDALLGATGKKRARISVLSQPGIVNIGTFHSICARILRNEIHRLGIRRDFVIYDADDQLRMVRNVLTENEYDLDLYPPQLYRSRISRAKNTMRTPDDIASDYSIKDAEQFSGIFREYNQGLRNCHALDFDDLLLMPLDLFRAHPKILNNYRKRFQFLLVDEYQDTNQAQFELVQLLSEKHGHITVVGDDDQSIYTWRGADITNILNFAKVFPDAKIFKLEQNYRSTKTILDAANRIVEKNRRRTPKKLWTDRDRGEKIQIYRADNERDEADKIIQLIQNEVLVNKRRFKDMVILYRTNSQSRLIEDALRKHTMAYQIVGGTRFYERKEIKDALAYIRLLVNQSDVVSLERVINFPPRSVGDTSLARLKAYASQNKIELFDALNRGHEAGIQPKQAKAMADFKAMIDKYSALIETNISNSLKVKSKRKKAETAEYLFIEEVVESLLHEAKLIEHYRSHETSEAYERHGNVKELMGSIRQFREDEGSNLIIEFLETVTLLTAIDNYNKDTNAVTLMTLHSAKGLEFPVAFLAGMEEGLCPLMRRADEDFDDEEERRLFYVGLTRAKDKVYLTYAKIRRKWGGSPLETIASQFIRELPPELTEQHESINAQDAFKAIISGNKKLRTPKQMQAEVMAAKSVLDDFVIGARVEHKIFGPGQISGRAGLGDSLKLKVNFDTGQIKNLVAKYANLTRL